jgi:REP element-mobilizing transposase RayT
MTEPKKIENHCRNYLPHIENKKYQMITFRLFDSVPKSVIEQWKATLNTGSQIGSQTSSLRQQPTAKYPAPLSSSRSQTSSLRQQPTAKYPAPLSSSSSQTSSLRQQPTAKYPAPLSSSSSQTSSLCEKDRQHDSAKESRRLLKLLDKYEDAGYGQCYLRDDRAAEIVRDALFYYDQVKYEVISWCIMPNHVHVLISLLKVVSLSEILHSWRSFSSNEINKLFNRKGQLWMPEYFDRYIRDERHFDNVVNYIHNNPVKAGLVDDPTHYRWSSAFVGLQASSLQENDPTKDSQASSLQETTPCEHPSNTCNTAGQKPADQIGQRE